jgi:lysophospholipase L1-like esterase
VVLKTMFKNMALVLCSVLLVVGLSVAADRVFGKLRKVPGLPETIELIFPPFAEQHYESLEFRYSVYINSIGIRDRELPRERGDSYRILAIGDSFTYGWGVDIENSWPRILQQLAHESGYEVEILNLGKPGSGPPFYSEIAEKAIPLLRPDLVLVCMLQGDDIRAAGPEEAALPRQKVGEILRKIYPNLSLYLRDLRREKEYGGRSHTEMPRQISSAEDNRKWTANTAATFLESMTTEQKERFDSFDDEVKEAYREGMLNPYLVDLAMQNPDFYILTMDMDDGWTHTCIDRTAIHFKRIKGVADRYGAKTVVVNIPEGPYVNRASLLNMRRVGYNLPEWLLQTTSPDESIEQAAEKTQLPYYGVTDQFRAHQEDPDLYFDLDGHPTPKGNHLFAEAFLPALKGIISDDK